LTEIGKIRLGFGAGCALLLMLSAAVVVRNSIWIENASWVSHTQQVLEQVGRVSLDLETADNTARRYSTSHGSSDLSAVRDALDDATKASGELIRLTADNPFQHRNATLVGELLERKVQLFGPLDASRQPETLAATVDAMDKTLLNAGIARVITDMHNEEHRLLVAREDSQEQSVLAGRLVMAATLLISVSLILLAGWRMSEDFERRTAVEKRLALRDEQYRQVVELAGDIIYRTDKQGRFTFCNPAGLTSLHYTEVEAMGRSYLKLIRQDKRREAQRFYLRQFLRKQKSTYYEFPVIDGHGRERWLGQNVQLILEDGKPCGFQSIAREITERKRAELELQKSRAFVERIAATTPGILYVFDIDQQRNVFSNREIITVLGHNPEELASMDRFTAQLVHPDDQPMINAHYDAMRQLADGEVRRIEYRARHSDGHWVWLSGRETPFERGADGTVRQVVGICQDITARKAAQDKLAYQANYDALTGLPNRHYFWTRLQSSLRRASIDRSATSLCLFDVDHFKAINDRFGHAVGDEVLEEVGNIVRGVLRTSDCAGRLGGDEFCFILPGTDEDEAARVAERIRERLSTLAFGMESGSPFSVTATFGVAESRPDIDAKELMEAADRALYRAKSAGRNRVCVDV
jgi:diguanylate cyclase (GGDEF)-like protein/PAS domain S-box-containing protein